MSQANWQPLIEGMLEAVWLVDPLDFRIVCANRAAERLLGAHAGGLQGRPVVELASTPEDLFFWEDVAAGLSDHICSETLLKRTDGSTIQVERRVTRVKLGAEGPLYVVSIRDFSDQRRVESELEKLLAELRATLESTADGILVADLDGAIRGYNQRFAELWTLPDELLTKRDDASVYAWMDQLVMDDEGYAARLRAISNSPLLEATDMVVLRTGRVLERVTLPQYARGRPIGRVYSFRDISKRLADQMRLQLAAKVFEASLDAIFVTDANFMIVAANPSCERLTGYTHDELMGMVPCAIVAEQGDVILQAQKTHLEREGYWEGEVWNRRKSGSSYPCLVSMVRVLDDQDQPINYVGFFKDLTESLAAKRKIEELAYTDALTGLPNRLMMTERAEYSINLARRNGSQLAVLFLDLDRFKHINDSLGHLFGDRVLVEVAERLKACIRQIDTAARLGGDEFVLLLNQVDGRTAEITARRVLESLNRPITLDSMNFTVTCSIGIAIFPDDGDSLDDLIKNADSAMYHVKERGRADFRFYQRQMNIGLLSRMKLDHAMRVALDANAFHLYFQPQLDLATNQLIGTEALIRWTDEELGEVAPSRFIPVAEESGLIVQIGHWVMTQAVEQAARWWRKGLKLPVSVNVSALQFQQSDFVDDLARALGTAGLPPEWLELELTESILILDVEDAMRRLQCLHELGVRLAIDDFGTGYSSLAYLKRFPIHKLKIDRSFINGLPEDESDVAIVRAIINLSKALKLKVIAEGVETTVQRDFLAREGCGEFQGFLCSPALPAADFEQFLYQRLALTVATT
ncbi:EAL domain-containing protein [Chitinivorax sp. B]|uniref:sensor domain-containing protein n=1 Tax=Chitinivorax sp. B TaxID=2502235 RepID=UPI0010F4C94F|nr:EAL domain-containing protein [Chitinivorax sp. B]